MTEQPETPDLPSNERWLVASTLDDLDVVTMSLKERNTPFEYVMSLEAVEGRLSREGYRYDVLVVDWDSLDYSDEWLSRITTTYYWLFIVLYGGAEPSFGQMAAGSTQPGDGLTSGMATWHNSLEPSQALSVIDEHRSSFVSSLPHAKPLAAGDTRYLADVNGVLFSLSQGERPWRLDADAIVVPMTNLADPCNLARAMDEAAPGSPTTFLSHLNSKLAGPMRSAEPKMIEPFEFGWSDGSPTTLQIIAATGYTQSGPAVDAAIEASLASIRLAGQSQINTLVLPGIGTGDGGLAAADVCQGILAGMRHGEATAYPKHVVFTVREEAQAKACRERVEKASARVQGQEFLNDEPWGRSDQLAIRQEVEALADAIALKELKPPLVVGVLGGWGSGKSFALDLLQRRLRWIRALPVPDGDEGFPYIGHPYIIWFNAWTYAKADLWASLMQTILEGLDRQLGLEDMLRDAGADLRQGTDVWKLLDELTDEERRQFEQSLGRQAVAEVVRKVHSSSAPVTADTLWNALASLHEAERQELEKEEADRRREQEALEHGRKRREEEIQEQLAKRRRIRKAAIAQLNERYAGLDRKERNRYADRVRLIAESALGDIEAARQKRIDAEAATDEDRAIAHERTMLDAERASIEARVDEAIAAESKRAAWMPFRSAVGGALQAAIDRILDKAQKDEDGQPQISFADLRAQIGRLDLFRAGVTRWTVAFLVFAGFSFALPFLIEYFSDGLALLGSAFAGVLAVVLPVFNAVQRAAAQLASKKSEYDEKVEEARSGINRDDRLAKRLAASDGTGASFNERSDTLAKRLSARGDEREKAIAEADEAIRAANAAQQRALLDAEAEHRHRLKEQERRLQHALERAKEKPIETTAIKDKREELAEFEREQREKIAELDASIEQRRDRIGITGRSASLLEFVREQLGSETYASKLGLVHQVQRDLNEVSRALETASRVGLKVGDDKGNPFPRGLPRIILMVDDLDRCPPPQVVEMLEAAQLLVKTDLFVVVLAMDVRYVTRTLEKHYKGVLVEDGDPSGLDYIEKIVQIPYRVPAIDPNVMERFLGSQLRVEAEQRTERTEEDEELEESKEEKTSGNVVFQVSKSEDLLPEHVQTISRPDLKLLARCCNFAGVSPRSGTRLANVFKLLKIIWFHRGHPDGPSTQIKEAILLLLAVAASYQEVVRLLLWRMEMALDTEARAKKLREFLDQELDTLPVPASLEQERREVKHATSHIGDGLTLADFGRENLRLVHSFCFAGEMTSKVPSVERETAGVEEDGQSKPDHGPAGKGSKQPAQTRLKKQQTRKKR